MTQDPTTHDDARSEEREFTASLRSSILGGPLSWVALFGALNAVTSMIPVVVYPLGGGYVSLGQILLFPLSGYLLGPWAGMVATGIGGAIGLFIAPGAYPLGPVDVVLAGVQVGLVYGLLARRWRSLLFVWWLLNLLLIYIFPYRWPGGAQGFSPPPEPAYTLSWLWVGVVFIIWLVWAYTPMGYWVRRGRPILRQIAGFSLTTIIGYGAVSGVGNTIWIYLLKQPVEITILDNWESFPLTIPVAIVSGIIFFSVFKALWRTGLLSVPGSLYEETKRDEKE